MLDVRLRSYGIAGLSVARCETATAGKPLNWSVSYHRLAAGRSCLAGAFDTPEFGALESRSRK